VRLSILLHVVRDVPRGVRGQEQNSQCRALLKICTKKMQRVTSLAKNQATAELSEARFPAKPSGRISHTRSSLPSQTQEFR
jgi:hypothetical protein